MEKDAAFADTLPRVSSPAVTAKTIGGRSPTCTKDGLRGRTLTGPYGTFWFVPVLFLTQQLANYLLQRLSPKAQAMLVATCLLAATQIPPGRLLPWAIDVVLVTFPVFWLGNRCKGHEPNQSLISAVGAIGVALCAFGLLPPLDIKNGQYGTPVLTLSFSLAAVYLICQFSRIQSPLTRPLQALGRASMTIMFVHPAVFMYLRDGLQWTNKEALLFAIAVTVPFLLHQLLERTSITQRIFLGQSRRDT